MSTLSLESLLILEVILWWLGKKNVWEAIKHKEKAFLLYFSINFLCSFIESDLKAGFRGV